ncbi:hypothetical protein [Mesorhizobium sp. M0676]|uniref:hypothetical protein n=1 Tax=Mesorhizobium sp. M0676 TaxID=2956984 RepID=UPI0033389304
MKDALPLRVSALRQKLTRLQGLTANAKEASDLAVLRKELATSAQAVANLVRQQTMLSGLGVKIQPPASLSNVRKRATTVREKFRTEKKSATLKKGTGWTSLLSDGDTAISDIERALLDGWRDFRIAVYSGDTPSVIDKRIARTPQNVQALNEYEQVYSQFSALFQTVPTSAATVETSKKLASDLVRISEKFDFAVGTEVKRFLAAVQSGGAPLALLTAEVLKWLADNKATEGYLIRASRQP